MDDRSLSSKEKDKYLSDLDELFIFDLQDLKEVPSVFICPLSTVN